MADESEYAASAGPGLLGCCRPALLGHRLRPAEIATSGPDSASPAGLLQPASERSGSGPLVGPWTAIPASNRSGRALPQILSENVGGVLSPLAIGAQGAYTGAARLATGAHAQVQSTLQDTDAKIKMNVRQEAGRKRWSAFIRPTVWFRHPGARIFVAFTVLAQDFLIYGEDPINDSHVRANFPFMGHIMGLLTLYAAPTAGLRCLRALLVVTAGLLGLIVGRIFLIKVVRGKLKIIAMMGCEGAIVVQSLFISIMLFLAVLFYNLVTSDPLDGASMELFLVLGAESLAFRHVNKCFQMGSGTVDVLTILMIIDVVLQDQGERQGERPYWPRWAVNAKLVWVGWDGRVRIIAFWVIFLVSTITCHQLVFSTGEREWRIRLTDTRFGGTSEVTRSFLAAAIVFTDLLTVVQDWEFPAFREPLDLNVPELVDQFATSAPADVMQHVPTIVQDVPRIAGTSWTTLQFDFIGVVVRSVMRCMPSIKVPDALARLWEWLPDSAFFKVSINGKWLTFGPLIGCMLIDLLCSKTQLTYSPVMYGQYVDPVDGRIWVITDEKYLEEAYDRGYIRPGKEEMISYAARWNLTTAEALSASAAADVKLSSRFITPGNGKWFGLFAALLVIVAFFIVYGVAEYQKHLQDAELMEAMPSRASRATFGPASSLGPSAEAAAERSESGRPVRRLPARALSESW